MKSISLHGKLYAVFMVVFLLQGDSIFLALIKVIGKPLTLTGLESDEFPILKQVLNVVRHTTIDIQILIKHIP